MTVGYDFSWEHVPLRIRHAAADAVRPPRGSLEDLNAYGFPDIELIRRAGPGLLLGLGDAATESLADAMLERTGRRPPDDVVAQWIAARLDDDEVAELVAMEVLRAGLVPSAPDYYGSLEKPWEHTSGAMTDDAPQLAVDLRGALLVDDQWYVDHGRDWTWWPTNLPIDICYGAPLEVLGDSSVRTAAVSPLVVEVDGPEQEVLEDLAARNSLASLYSLVWHPQERLIAAHVAYTAHRGNASMLSIFSAAVVLLACDAADLAEDLSRVHAGRPAHRAHPTSGWRSEPDDLVNYTEDAVLPAGREPSRFSPSDRELDPSELLGSVAPSESDGVLQTELAFDHDVAVALSKSLGMPLGTSLLQVFIEGDHPVLGAGALLQLRLPHSGDQSPALFANNLNSAESTLPTGFSSFGAWSSDLSHSCFIPNAFYRPGLVGTLAHAAAWRNIWTAENMPNGGSISSDWK